MTELRSYLFIDRLQPKTLCFLAGLSQGCLPRADASALVLDVAPALDMEFLADKALKAVDVAPFIIRLDSRGGWLGVHGNDADEVKTAGEAFLEVIGAAAAEVPPPRVLNRQVVSRVDERHAFALNRQSPGSLCLPGESLFLLDCRPSPYALLAVNEAEKAANIKVVNFRFTGSTGRLYLSGTDSEIRVAAEAAETALLKLGARG